LHDWPGHDPVFDPVTTVNPRAAAATMLLFVSVAAACAHRAGHPNDPARMPLIAQFGDLNCGSSTTSAAEPPVFVTPSNYHSTQSDALRQNAVAHGIAPFREVCNFREGRTETLQLREDVSTEPVTWLVLTRASQAFNTCPEGASGDNMCDPEVGDLYVTMQRRPRDLPRQAP
jgi:hypothetical protein